MGGLVVLSVVLWIFGIAITIGFWWLIIWLIIKAVKNSNRERDEAITDFVSEYRENNRQGRETNYHQKPEESWKELKPEGDILWKSLEPGLTKSETQEKETKEIEIYGNTLENLKKLRLQKKQEKAVKIKKETEEIELYGDTLENIKNKNKVE